MIFNAISALTLPWIVIYGLKYLHQTLLGRRSRTSALPQPISLRGHDRPLSSSRTTLTLHGVYLRVETTALNSWSQNLVGWLDRKCTRARLHLTRFYDFGTALSTTGMLAMVGILLYACAIKVQALSGAYSSGIKSTLVKRGLEGETAASLLPSSHESNGDFLQPVIPGVTVPLSHLPVILTALLLSQVLHEAGHAISASLESLTPLSVGLSYIFVLPTAFVALPSGALAVLKPHVRARIAAAGCLHNAMCVLMLWATARSGMTRFAYALGGWRDVGQWGRVVAAVSYTSPLREYILPGEVITRLDDTMLSSDTPHGHEDKWSDYLLADANSLAQMSSTGWCIVQSVLQESDELCCERDERHFSSDAACFEAAKPSSRTHPHDRPQQSKLCIHPTILLTNLAAKRCSTSFPSDSPRCSEDEICVFPRTDEKLMRIYVSPDVPANGVGAEGEHVVLWKGPRQEVYQQVTVSHLMPRWGWAWVRRWLLVIPGFVNLVYEYALMVNASLSLFNLLPFSRLDGAQLLDALLPLLLGVSVAWSSHRSEDEELEMLERGQDSSLAPDPVRQGRRSIVGSVRTLDAIARVVKMGTAVLVGSFVVLSILQSI